MSPERVVKFGRGGAGNIRTLKDAEQASEIRRHAEDIEKQDRKSIVDAILETRAPATYAHSGRGGAGNLFSPADAPKPNEPEPANVINAGIRRPSLQGRGGFGNFDGARLPPRIVGEDSKLQGEGKQERSSREVDEQVRSPERAYLGDGRHAEHGEL